MKIANKTILITGASKGLGRELAFCLAHAGANLILVARDKTRLEKTRNEIETQTGRMPLIISSDIAREEEVNFMAGIIREKFAHIDILINNAGIGIHRPSQNICCAEMRSLFEVNFFGAYYCIKALLPLIRKSAAGYILNIGSLVSELAFADNSVYAASKSALAVFSQGLRLELKPDNIKIGYFLPGLMKTSFQNDRKQGVIPGFMFLSPRKAVQKIEAMLIKRKSKAYMYRWMLLLMRFRQMLD